VNYKIRVPQVRCIGADGQQIGVIATSEAMRMAESLRLDLVEISPNANPPVCRIMDYGKFKYEENRKEKLARKHQASVVLKEVKFHANVDDHDYQTKLNHIRGFLEKGHRVKASLYFRGRENEHRELGFDLFKRLEKDIAGQGAVETPGRLFGNNLVMILRPAKAGSDPKPAQPPAPTPPRPMVTASGPGVPPKPTVTASGPPLPPRPSGQPPVRTP
jgi:translation initiation factor IF-3